MKKILKEEVLAAESREIARRNIAIVKKWVESTKKVSWIESNGGMCFPKLKGVKSSARFAEYLLKNHDTLVSPGFFFGLDGHIRIGLGGPGEILEGGLAQLGEALKAYRE
jgi:hypothetical protein